MSRPAMAACARCHASVFSRSVNASKPSAYTCTMTASSIRSRRYLRSAAAERKYLLERIDDAVIVQVYADGFDALTLREKTLAWHLAQAAIAGRDIFYDQRYPHNLVMRDVLEAIVSHGEHVDPATLAQIQRYTKLFWINTGPYNSLTSRKFVLTCAPEAFAAAARAAAGAGAVFPVRPGETLDALLERLRPMFFDPEFDPSVTCKTPGGDRDILSASANNLYFNVRMHDLGDFLERYPLSSRLGDSGEQFVEEVYRVVGRYGGQSNPLVGHSEAAIAFAAEPT